MNTLNLMIKPASSLCNLRCRYCFYHDEAAKRQQASCGIMTADTMERTIAAALESARRVSFLFQGGEPTLAGLGFFQAFVDAVRRLNRSRTEVSYALQTNGALMSEAFAAFLKENGFLVGLSLDGPGEIHDRQRVDSDGNGSFRRAMDCANLLNCYAIPYNVLCVVTSPVARRVDSVYHFFTGHGFDHLQFVPCVDLLGEPPFSQKHSLTPEEYGQFLTRLYDLWLEDLTRGKYVSIRFFDNFIQTALGLPAEQCGLQGACTGQLVVEADGSLYPCDFYCVDPWRIGSIADMTIEQAFRSPVMRKFIETSSAVEPECASCDVYRLCRGGCRRNRDSSLYGEAGKNHYCAALKEFYQHAVDRLPNALVALRLINEHSTGYTVFNKTR